jgi:hypothetical protein
MQLLDPAFKFRIDDGLRNARLEVSPAPLVQPSRADRTARKKCPLVSPVPREVRAAGSRLTLLQPPRALCGSPPSPGAG